MMHLDVLKHETPGAATKLASVTHGYLARPSLTFTAGGIMYPKIIWQDIVSVRGEDHAMRVVQVAPDEAVVEWVASRDTMGCPMWCRFEDWYPTLVGDLMRKACLTLRETDTAMYKLGTADKINLIRLVRVATQMHEKTLTRSLAPGCMGLKDAKDLVEKWLDNPRGDL